MGKIYLAQFSVVIEDQFVFFPFSAGCIWAYAESKGTVSRKDLGKIFYIKEPIQDILDQLNDPKIFGFSHYVWNEKYNDTLAKAVKDLYPDCLIVYGGPQVPDDFTKPWYKERSWVDVCVHQEGEKVFNQLIAGEPLETIKGISFNKNGWHKNQPKDRIFELDELPSPYTMGLFDEMITDELVPNMVMETDRGCPYKCTFCDWGSATFSKVRKMDLDRVFSEIEWAGKNKVEMLLLANANFGIFKERDNQIVDKIIATKNKYGYPKTYDGSWAKNSNKDVLALSKKLKDADLLRKFGISMQSMSPTVLENIKRSNMKINDFEGIIKEAEGYGISVMVELIVGLPGETYDSWTENYAKLMEYKNINVEHYPLSLLNNSELNDPHTIKEFQLKYEIVDFGAIASHIIEEKAMQITSTSTLPPEDLKKVWQWSWCARLGHTLGITNVIADKCKELGITTKKFYDKWFEYIRSSKGILNEKFELWNQFLSEYDYMKYNFNYEYLDDIGHSRRKETIKDIKQFLEFINIDNSIAYLFDIYYYTPEYTYPKTFGDITVDHKGMGSVKKYSSYIGLNRKNSGWKCKELDITIKR